MSLWGFFNVGFGAVIGSCWLLLIGDWMVDGGGPMAVIVAFLLGMLLMLPIASVFGETAAAVPFAGGPAQVVGNVQGNTAALVAEWAFVLGNGIVPAWDALMVSYIISQIVGSLPGMEWVNGVVLYTIAGSDVRLVPVLFSFLAVVLVGSLNLRYDFSSERFQSLLSVLQLCGMIVVVAVAAAYGTADNALPVFERVIDTPSGSTTATGMFSGVLSVLAVTPFFYAGFDAIPQRADEAAEGVNWNKFGKVIVMTLLASAGFYLVTTYCFATIEPWKEFVAYDLPAFAVLRKTNGVAYLAMIVVAIFCPLGPMNSFVGATSSVLTAMAGRGHVPKALGSVDSKTGSPKAACLVVVAASLLGPLLGVGLLAPLSRVASLALSFSYLVMSVACLRMRFTMPQIRRPFKVPGGVAGMALACATSAVCVAIMVVPGSPAALSKIEWGILVGWIGISVLVTTVVSRAKAKQDGIVPEH